MRETDMRRTKTELTQVEERLSSLFEKFKVKNHQSYAVRTHYKQQKRACYQEKQTLGDNQIS